MNDSPLLFGCGKSKNYLNEGDVRHFFRLCSPNGQFKCTVPKTVLHLEPMGENRWASNSASDLTSRTSISKQPLHGDKRSSKSRSPYSRLGSIEQSTDVLMKNVKCIRRFAENFKQGIFFAIIKGNQWPLHDQLR